MIVRLRLKLEANVTTIAGVHYQQLFNISSVTGGAGIICQSLSFFQLSSNLKVLLDNWNITTTHWLRHVVYERVPVAKTAMVFVVSAFWHGFYPGYYITFLTGALFTYASRLVRIFCIACQLAHSQGLGCK